MVNGNMSAHRGHSMLIANLKHERKHAVRLVSGHIMSAGRGSRMLIANLKRERQHAVRLVNGHVLSARRGHRMLIVNLKRERDHAVWLLSTPCVLAQIPPADRSSSADYDRVPRLLYQGFVVVALLSVETGGAAAHGIAGNRYFDGTMTFDDPAVADEATLPYFITSSHPSQGSNVKENRFDFSFARLLTPTLAITYDSGWLHQNWPVGHTSGFDTSSIGLKYEAYRNNEHETLVSVSAAWGIAHSGAQGVGADEPNTIRPGIFFGKGFGDLPDSLSWLRPFAVTAAIVDQHPFGSDGTALAPNLTTGTFASVRAPAVETLNWGFSLQYSTYYLTDRFTGGPPTDEPLNQLVPLVEFSFDSPRGQYTAATMNPGIAYVAVTWQISAEAIVPLNREGGTGFRAQLLFFLDDLLPSIFGKPLLSNQPDRSQIAW
jgi:hypothetical protein